MFTELISLHPIKQQENLYAVHHFYEVMRAHAVQATFQSIEAGISALCAKIPASLAPVMPTCTLQLCSGVQTQVGVATHTTPFTMATKLPKVYNPQSLYELTPWDHFSTSMMHKMTGISPEYQLYSLFRSEIAGIVSRIEHHVNTLPGSSTELRPVEVIQGYTRFSEEIGREYILDVMFIDAENRNNVQTKRIRLIRPLSHNITMVAEEYSNLTAVVNVVLPILKADRSFFHFMDWYYKAASQDSKANLHLILCVIGDANTLYTTQATVDNYSQNSPGSRATVLSGTKELSPLGVLELGMSILSGEDLVFVVDTSLRIQPFFFRSCRQNTARGSKIYFPSPYVMFREPQHTPRPGRWAFYSYSSMCIYKSDFLNFSDSPKRLFHRISKSSLELFQAPESGLIRVGRAKSCNGLSDVEKERYCRDLLESAQFDSSMSDYLYEHDRGRHKSLSFLEYEESM